jgi:hypothetical protein
VPAEHRAALLEWLEGGGALVGVHCASDTWYEWPAYQERLGGIFDRASRRRVLPGGGSQRRVLAATLREAAVNVTVRETIEIAASPEVVWDFTQDWRRRQEWDRSVASVEFLEEFPLAVRVRQGGLTFVNRYKLADRPRRTSVAMTDIRPGLLFTSGGGSWEYAPAAGGGTIWTQQNTIRLRSRVLGWLLGPLVRLALRRAARQVALPRFSGHRG